MKRIPGRIRILTSKEENALVNCFIKLGYPDFGDLVQILIDTGMREGNAIRLQWRDVDFITGLISIWENKAEKPYSIPMTTRVQSILKKRFESGLKKPFPIGQSTFQHVFTRVRVKLGITDPQFVAHALRHTACTRLIAVGMPLKKVKEFMGHKLIETTERYIHLNPEDLRDLAVTLEKFGTTFGTTLSQK